MRKLLLSAIVAAYALVGCGGRGIRLGPGDDYVKPTIAVMKFENRASFPVRWDLGGGMRDILVDRLVATGRFQVVERPELGSVMKEIQFQQSGATRPENRAATGRLKNVEYLIKGTVTDFGHVSTKSGFLSWADRLDIFGSGQRAVLSMTLYVVEVESGQIVCSESISDSVRATDTNVKVAYKDVAFGGSVFYRTPLGRVTADVIDQAVKKAAREIAARPWVPKVALVRQDGTVVLNGGKDRGVKVGQVYELYEHGDAIFNPDTGDLLGRQPGPTLGRVRVTEVEDLYCVAAVVSGDARNFAVGQPCRPARLEGAEVSRTGVGKSGHNEPRP